MAERVADIIRRFIDDAHAVPAELARTVGISEPWIYMILSGKRLPTEELIDAMAGPLKLTPEQHQELRDATTYARADANQKNLLDRLRARASRPPAHVTEDGGIPVVLIPVLSSCPGGDPMMYHNDYPPEVAAEYLPVSADFLTEYPEAFAVKIVGDSMSPRYPAGTYLVTAPNMAADIGEPAILCLEGQSGDTEITCKVWTVAGKQVILSPLNPAHSPLVVPRERVRWAYGIILKLGWEKKR